jgi:hypothetical protein
MQYSKFTLSFLAGKGPFEDPLNHDFIAEELFKGSLATGDKVYLFANCCGQLGWPPRGKGPESQPFTYKPCDHSRSRATRSYHPGHLATSPSKLSRPEISAVHPGNVSSDLRMRTWSCCQRRLGESGNTPRNDLNLELHIRNQKLDIALRMGLSAEHARAIEECAAHATLLEAARGELSGVGCPDTRARTILDGVRLCSNLNPKASQALLRRVVEEGEREESGLTEEFWQKFDIRRKLWGLEVQLAEFDVEALLRLHRLSAVISKGKLERVRSDEANGGGRCS